MPYVSKFNIQGTEVDIKDANAVTLEEFTEFEEKVDAKLPDKLMDMTLHSYYIDTQNGDNDNTGENSSSCLKTINKAFDLIEERGENNIRIVLMTSGIYELSRYHFSGISWHMSAQASDVTVRFTGLTTNEGCTLYNCHTSFSCNQNNAPGAKLILEFEGNGLYFDGGYQLFTNCDFRQRLTVHGGELHISSSNLSGVQVDRGICALQDINFINTDTFNYCIDVDHASTLSTEGTINVGDIASRNAFFRICRSTAFLGSPIYRWNSNTSKANYGVYIVEANITSSASMKTQLLNLGNTGAYLAGGVGSVYTWNTTTGTAPE